MGYDIPFFSPHLKMHSIKMCSIRSAETEKNSPFRFLMNSGGKYDLENSDPESFVLKESRENGDTYLFVFSHEGTSTEKIKLTFSLMPRRCGCFNQRLSDNGQF